MIREILILFIALIPFTSYAQEEIDSIQVKYIGSVNYAYSMRKGTYKKCEGVYVLQQQPFPIVKDQFYLPSTISEQKLSYGLCNIDKYDYCPICINDSDVVALNTVLEDTLYTDMLLGHYSDPDSIRHALRSKINKWKGEKYEHNLTEIKGTPVFELRVFYKNKEQVSLRPMYNEEGGPWILKKADLSKKINCEKAISMLETLGLSGFVYYTIAKDDFLLRFSLEHETL